MAVSPDVVTLRNSSELFLSTLLDNNTEQPFVGDLNNATKTDPLITLTVPATMFACGVFGNLVAILVLLRSSREHKQTVFYRLVGALAVTDLFGTCATSPVTLAAYVNKLQWVGGQPLCNYEAFMFIFVSCTTIFIIGSMAMDRAFAIASPYFYERQFIYTRANFYIVCLWGLAALIGCLPLIGLGQVVIQFPGSWCFFTFTSAKTKNKIFAYGYASIGLFVVCLTGIANIIVTSILVRMRRTFSSTMSVVNRKRNDCELQMMILMLGVIVVFATCWCPFLIRILINQWHERQVNKGADLITLRLASLNQILDPWVYILFRKEFFKKIYNFLREHASANCTCLFISTQDRILPHNNVNSCYKENEQTRSNAHTLDCELVPLNIRNATDDEYHEEYDDCRIIDINSDEIRPQNNFLAKVCERPLLLRTDTDFHTIKWKQSYCISCNQKEIGVSEYVYAA